jgi:transcriptional regulator with XRE-family HTH domain
MSGRNRLGEFLRARREMLAPPAESIDPGPRRRTPGLRREEIAMLAGVSTDYYVRLEQGRERHPSAQVLDALARVLQLREEETDHLHSLVRPVRRSRSDDGRVAAGLVGLMQHWTDTPALVLDRLMNIRACNAIGRFLYEPFGGECNLLRMAFLNPAAPEFYVDWQRSARNVVGTLRAANSGFEDDPALAALVGELSVHSEEFARLWARHDVRGKVGDTKRLHHPEVGPLFLRYESFTVNGAPGQQLLVYHADPGSPSEDSLALLGSLVGSRRGGRVPAAPRKREPGSAAPW